MARALAFIPFLLAAVAILAGMHYYLWLRLVRDPALFEPWRTGLTLFIALAALSVPVGMIIAHELVLGKVGKVIAASIYIWMGVAFLLFSTLLFADLIRLLASAGIRIGNAFRSVPEPPPDPARRIFLGRAIAGGAALVAGTNSVMGMRIATRDPEIHEVPVQLSRLPRELSGLSIVQISDFHVGPTIGAREVQRAVAATNALKPDVVAITGDLVDASVEELREAVSEISKLQARYGVFFVTGNHEYYVGVEPWLAELRRLGVRVMRNERVTIGDTQPGGASIDLAGIDDWSADRYGHGHGPDLTKALAGRDPARSLVLLAHQPRGVSEAVRSGVELQISGHTHGGQIFPFSLLVGAIYRYSRGLYRHREPDGGEGQVFVSRGIGFWGPPMRLGAPPEIARIVLTRA